MSRLLLCFACLAMTPMVAMAVDSDDAEQIQLAIANLTLEVAGNKAEPAATNTPDALLGCDPKDEPKPKVEPNNWAEIGHLSVPSGWVQAGPDGSFVLDDGDAKNLWAIAGNHNLWFPMNNGGVWSSAAGLTLDGPTLGGAGGIRDLQVHLDSEGQRTVTLNGETVDDSRVESKGGYFIVRGEGGQTLLRMRDGAQQGVALEWSTRAPGATTVTRRSMIGITMETLPEALSHHLDLAANEAVMVGQVHDGYPSQKAGLQKYDVITHVDGKPGVTPAKIGAATRAKSDGDTITLRVLRRGHSFDVEVTVEERDYSPPSIRSGVPFLQNLPVLGEQFRVTRPQLLRENRPGLHFDRNSTMRYRVIPPEDASGGVFAFENLATPPQDAAAGSENSSSTQQSLQRLEVRLERLEKLLQELGDRKSF